METYYMTEEAERAKLIVEASPVWEVILGISGYTYAHMRHTFEFDEVWKRQGPPDELVTMLQTVQSTNLWHGIILLQDMISAKDIQYFSNEMKGMSTHLFYETLLPYKSRNWEEQRKKAAQSIDEMRAYASLFSEHEFLEGYVLALCRYSREALMILIENVLKGWLEWVSTDSQWNKWMSVLKTEQNQYNDLKAEEPAKEIKRIAGIDYMPEPSIWKIKLVPHVSYRPWVLEKRSAETKLLFYPVNDAYFREKGSPSSELVRGHKALGDELRLQLLYQLKKGPASLAELSDRFQISKTTLHHQLSLLKAAKFVHVNKGIYTANEERIDSFSGKLDCFLREQP